MRGRSRLWDLALNSARWPGGTRNVSKMNTQRLAMRVLTRAGAQRFHISACAAAKAPQADRIQPAQIQDSITPTMEACLHDVRACLQTRPTPLHTLSSATAALREELNHTRTRSGIDMWPDVAAMYLDAVETASTLDVASALFSELASLAPRNTATLPRVGAVGLRVFHAAAAPHAPSSIVREVWLALRELSRPSPHDTAPTIRTLLLRNRLGDATRMLQWHIRQHWHHGHPAPSRALMHTLMIQMRTVERVLRTRQAPAPGRFGASGALYAEYAAALAVLGTLLRDNCLPLVPHDKEDITWLIKLLYDFDALGYRAPLTGRAERTIHATLPRFVQRLPCGRPPYNTSAVARIPHPSSRNDRANYFVPVLSERSYNALVQYTLHHANSPRACRQVLEHMTHVRTPPLAPSAVTVNILLRQATRRRLDALGAYALELGASLDPARTWVREEDVTLPSAEGPDASALALHLSPPRLLAHLDEALAQNDTYRLVALVQHIALCRLRTAAQPDGVRAVSVVLRLYPELRRTRPHTSAQAAHHPRVYTATLYLAARAHKTALALRVWRLLKQACAANARPVPPAAAAAVMRLLADAGGRQRSTMPWAGRRRLQRDVRAQQARTVALQEYAWLLRHWAALGGARGADAGVYVPLLRLLRRTAMAPDGAYARVLEDIDALGLGSSPRLMQALSATRRR